MYSNILFLWYNYLSRKHTIPKNTTSFQSKPESETIFLLSIFLEIPKSPILKQSISYPEYPFHIQKHILFKAYCVYRFVGINIYFTNFSPKKDDIICSCIQMGETVYSNQFKLWYILFFKLFFQCISLILRMYTENYTVLYFGNHENSNQTGRQKQKQAL